MYISGDSASTIKKLVRKKVRYRQKCAQQCQIAGAVFIWKPLSSVEGSKIRGRVSMGIGVRRGNHTSSGAAGQGPVHGHEKQGLISKGITTSGPVSRYEKKMECTTGPV